MNSEEKTVCMTHMCAGCMACVNICPKQAITIKDTKEAYDAVIDSNRCINCKLCEKICPQNNTVENKKPIYWKQGWAKDESVRKTSSSGGAATAIINTVLKQGGYVASCVFKNSEFGFLVTNNIKEGKLFAGSKYVKSNPGNVYIEVKRLISKGEKVLFIGLPCQVAAIRKICEKSENLITADLVCHGTPSPKLLEQFLLENGIELNSIANIKFRDEELFGLYPDKRKISPNRVVDSYTNAFLKGIDYTENCYQCKYACYERISDITFGDAWGQLSDTSPEGVSLILCQTEKGKKLIEQSDLELRDVDIDKAVNANHQLQHPSYKHPRREVFFRSIENGKTIRTAVFKAMPKESIKQSLKHALIKMHLLKDFMGGGV